FDREAQRLALAGDDRRDLAAREVVDRLGVEPVVDVAWQRAPEHDELGALRQVPQLLEQRLELLPLHARAPFVDLGVRAAGRVDDRRRGPRLALDPDEVVEKRLLRQSLDDPRPGHAADEPGGDDGHAERLQRARDVDALAAGERQPGAGAVALPALEVGHRDRAVDRCVERDGDDHRKNASRWWAVRVAYQRIRLAGPGRATLRTATSGRVPSRRCPAQTSTRPSCWPRCT